MAHFYYFICLETNKDLLKEEIKLFAPELRPSFSKGCFLTYKSETPFTKDLCFALDWGESKDLSPKHIDTLLESQNYLVPLPEEAPSRAYLKIAEAFEIFKLPKNQSWIEFGCAPGGASYFLLQLGKKLIGVDPAEMDDIVLKNKKFKHIKKPIQNLKQSHFPDLNIDYITSDLNLNPKQAVDEVLRCSAFFNNLKGILMTIKMVKNSHIKNIPSFKKSFIKAGFSKIQVAQLPSHKREFLIFATKE